MGSGMRKFFDNTLRVSRVMQTISAVALTFIILLTTVDVVARIFGRPVAGAVEIIAICGGLVIGLAIPITSLKKGHITVDLLTDRLPNKGKTILGVCTRCVGIGLCLIITWNLAKIGTGFLKAREVSGTLLLPLYPIAYVLALCFLVLAIVLVSDISRTVGGTDE